uniref:Ras-related protein Rab-7L1 n=1 Tax=Lygus hesperus TaxID=30085 RepID=A0A0A9WWE0_LYGHE
MERDNNGAANTHQWKRGGGDRASFRKLEVEKFADENSEPESDGHYYYTPPSYDSLDFSPRKRGLPEKLFKVIIIGDPTVGKTSFIQRYVQNSFARDYKGTVGVDFALKVLHWYDSQVIKLQLWDIAGQERFTWMTRVYYKDAHGCVIMFDLSNKNSFENTLKWKKDLDSKCSLADGSPVPCMLLANKEEETTTDRYFVDRSISFGDEWPHCFIPPRDLVKEGMYFLEAPDTVSVTYKIERLTW